MEEGHGRQANREPYHPCSVSQPPSVEDKNLEHHYPPSPNQIAERTAHFSESVSFSPCKDDGISRATPGLAQKICSPPPEHARPVPMQVERFAWPSPQPTLDLQLSSLVLLLLSLSLLL